jgi:hypothetical protein
MEINDLFTFTFTQTVLANCAHPAISLSRVPGISNSPKIRMAVLKFTQCPRLTIKKFFMAKKCAKKYDIQDQDQRLKPRKLPYRKYGKQK